MAVDGRLPITSALAAVLDEAGARTPWLERAGAWCWAELAHPGELHPYAVKFSLAFLDAVPDASRATAVIETLRPRVGADGSIAVTGGTDDERLTPLALSPSPGSRSRAIFTPQQIDDDLDRLERAQQDDGGWTFDWLGWSAGQSVELRGIVTLLALATLSAHGRIDLPRAGS